MDRYAFRVANMLVGNPENAAGIEITVYGLRLRTDKDILIAITGGDLSPEINKAPVPMWVPLWLRKGDILDFKWRRSGFRAYVAVRGGIDVPPVMNSRSTMVKAGFGGTGGALKPGDTLPVGETVAVKDIKLKPLPDQFVPKYEAGNRLFVVLGPQQDYFTQDGVQVFLNSEYTITPQSDRQGYRLNGPKVTHVNDYNVVTEPAWPGVIEIPGDGFPIILLADSGTTGGYLKIASVISADLDKLGQAKPSDKILFEAVPLDKAYRLLKEKETVIKKIQSMLWQ
jgi:biotin-dependent carboxylase-like uncharacterized protein